MSARTLALAVWGAALALVLACAACIHLAGR